MSFHQRAWNSAADQYGANRAEKYGKIAGFFRLVGIMAVIVLAVAVYVVASRGPQ